MRPALSPLLALAACAARSPGSADGSAPSLADRLREEAGGRPVLLVAGEAGVAAVAPDGALIAALIAGPVEDAAWDARMELLWLLREGRIEALDLRLARPEPVVLAERVPSGQLRVARWSPGEGFRYTSSPRERGDWIGIAWGQEEPKVEGGYGPLEHDEAAMAERLALVAQAELADPSWLSAEASRPLRPAPPNRPLAPERAIPLPEGAECRQDPEWPMCGAAVELGPWLLVVEQTSCGDMCWASCRLYDPATSQPLPADPRRAPPASLPRAEGCGPYQLDAAGQWFLAWEGADQLLCAFSGGCRVVDGLALGWLDPGESVGLE